MCLSMSIHLSVLCPLLHVYFYVNLSFSLSLSFTCLSMSGASVSCVLFFTCLSMCICLLSSSSLVFLCLFLSLLCPLFYMFFCVHSSLFLCLLLHMSFVSLTCVGWFTCPSSLLFAFCLRDYLSLFMSFLCLPLDFLSIFFVFLSA